MRFGERSVFPRVIHRSNSSHHTLVMTTGNRHTFKRFQVFIAWFWLGVIFKRRGGCRSGRTLQSWARMLAYWTSVTRLAWTVKKRYSGLKTCRITPCGFSEKDISHTVTKKCCNHTEETHTMYTFHIPVPRAIQNIGGGNVIVIVIICGVIKQNELEFTKFVFVFDRTNNSIQFQSLNGHISGTMCPMGFSAYLRGGINKILKSPRRKGARNFIFDMWSMRHLYIHCVKLHTFPTIYWLSTDQIGRKSAILRLTKIYNFCESALNMLNQRLYLAVMFMVRFCSELCFHYN